MKNKLILSIFAFGLTIGSCSEDSLDKTNPNQLTQSSYFKSIDDLFKATNGVYAMFQSVPLVGREYFFLHDLRSDDMSSGGGQLEAPRNQILIGAQTSTNPVLGAVFTNFYKLIHRANSLIELAPGATVASGDEALRTRLVAEARFLRALAYYQLAGFWGGVPLYTEYGKSFGDARPRSTQDEIYDFVIAELTAASQDLPVSYGDSDLGRATKGAALTVLAKAYLFKNDYANAKTQLEVVKGLGYALVDNYFDNFMEETEFNTESIFEVVWTSSGYFNWDGDGNDYGPNESWIRTQEYSAVGWRNLIPSNSLLADFEANDPRVNDSFWFIGDSFGDPASPDILTDDLVQGNTSIFNAVTQKVSWKKYSVMYKLNPGGYYEQSGINFRMIRYADVLLMLAECENEIGSAATAIGYLNQVRNRASVNMPNYPTSAYPVNSKDEIMKAIIHERRVEFGGEEVRNFDILRWRKFNKLPSEPISYFTANKQELLPLPADEINNNVNIGNANQNPGY